MVPAQGVAGKALDYNTNKAHVQEIEDHRKQETVMFREKSGGRKTGSKSSGESCWKCGQNKQGYRTSQNRGKKNIIGGGNNMNKSKQQMCLLALTTVFHSVKKCGHMNGQRLCRRLEKS